MRELRIVVDEERPDILRDVRALMSNTGISGANERASAYGRDMFFCDGTSFKGGFRGARLAFSRKAREYIEYGKRKN